MVALVFSGMPALLENRGIWHPEGVGYRRADRHLHGQYAGEGLTISKNIPSPATLNMAGQGG
jgi:hypothetical protein